MEHKIKKPFIILSEKAIEYASWYGAKRYYDNKSWGTSRTFNPQEGPQKNLLWDKQCACSEYALALLKGLKWFPDNPKWKTDPDVPPNWDVKCTDKDWGSLIIRDGNNPDRQFALITFDWEARKFTYHGWLLGHKIRELGIFYPANEKTNLPSCHMIAQCHLIKDWL